MLKVNAPYNIAVTRKYFLFLLFFLAFGWGTACAAEADPTVAERNAAQGFNDTIDRLAPDFVTVSLAALRTTRQTMRIAGIAVDCLVLTITTAFGLLTTYLVAFSHLPCTDWNWLIIPFNLLPVLAWPWRKYWALPYLVMIVLWCIGMLCAPHRLVESAHILLALAFAVVLLKQSPLWSRWYKRNAV